MSISTEEAVCTSRSVVRKYGGEFLEPKSYSIAPEHLVGYWGLECDERWFADGTHVVYYKITLASFRGPQQMRSAWCEDYHSDTKHHSKPLSLIPSEILDQISEATGEVFPRSFDPNLDTDQ